MEAMDLDGLSLDGTRDLLQSPVATLAMPPAGVGRGGDISAGGLGKMSDKGRTIRALGHVAAIDQEVAIVGERLPHGGQLGLDHGIGHVCRGNLSAAQMNLALGPMAQHMDGVIAGMGFGPLRHLGQSVGPATDLDNGHAIADARLQGLVIGDRSINEGNLLLAAILGGVRLAHRHWSRRGLDVHFGRRMDNIRHRSPVEHDARLQSQDHGAAPFPGSTIPVFSGHSVHVPRLLFGATPKLWA
nr:hypothetical protein [Paramagnetospirillum marisnigri]